MRLLRVQASFFSSSISHAKNTDKLDHNGTSKISTNANSHYWEECIGTLLIALQDINFISELQTDSCCGGFKAIVAFFKVHCNVELCNDALKFKRLKFSNKQIPGKIVFYLLHHSFN